MIRTIAILGSFLFLACQEKPAAENIKPEDIKTISLLYISNKSDNFDIYKNTTDGQQEKRLTLSPGFDWYPQYNAKRNCIFYNSQDSLGVFRVNAMSTDGSDIPVKTGGLAGFDISPNRGWNAYTRKSRGASNIVIAPLGKLKDSIRISNGSAYNGRPKWTASGDKLAYVSDRDGSNEIYLYDRASGQTSRLTQNDGREKYLSWNPDGSKLAFTMSTGSSLNDIYIYNLNNSQITQLTDSSVNEAEISWSPDGKYMAYHTKRLQADDIYTLEIATGIIRKVTDSKSYHGEPMWMIGN